MRIDPSQYWFCETESVGLDGSGRPPEQHGGHRMIMVMLHEAMADTWKSLAPARTVCFGVCEKRSDGPIRNLFLFIVSY